jgi:hypothetical protein
MTQPPPLFALQKNCRRVFARRLKTPLTAKQLFAFATGPRTARRPILWHRVKNLLLFGRKDTADFLMHGFHRFASLGLAFLLGRRRRIFARRAGILSRFVPDRDDLRLLVGRKGQFFVETFQTTFTHFLHAGMVTGRGPRGRFVRAHDANRCQERHRQEKENFG